MVMINIAPGITLEIVPHPDEVIDVDPEIIRNMTKRLCNDYPTIDACPEEP